MDGRHRGALPHAAGQTGEILQVHRDVCCDAENRSRTPHGKLLLLGHGHGRKLHSEMGEPHHVLCGQCVRCGCRIKHTHTLINTHKRTQKKSTRRGMQCVPMNSRGSHRVPKPASCLCHREENIWIFFRCK